MSMNIRKSICTILLLSANFALANEDRYNREVIKEYALDSKTLYNIPIGNTPTTIAFPSPLSSIDGANVSNDPSVKAPVLLSYQEGQYFFSVKATQSNAQAAINVVYNEQTYAFNFYHREDSSPYRTVRLYREEVSNTYGRGASTRSLTIRKATPKVLLALLDRAKSYSLVSRAYPGKLDEEVQHLAPSLSRPTGILTSE